MSGKELLGVVLSGGKSSRLGQDKASLVHPDGGTFLQHAIARLESLCSQVCVAGQNRDTNQPTGNAATSPAHILPDPVAFAGPISGIVSSLQYAHDHSFAACLVTPVDMPHLKTGDLNQIVSTWQETSQLTCAINQDTQQLQPLVAIYPVTMLGDLQALAAADDRSVKRWFQTQTHQSVPLTPKSCHNVNTRDDVPE